MTQQYVMQCGLINCKIVQSDSAPSYVSTYLILLISLHVRTFPSPPASVFKWTFLPVELERGTETLQFDVCCEAIHQNFDCCCILKKGYGNLQLSANQNKKLQYMELLA